MNTEAPNVAAPHRRAGYFASEADRIIFEGLSDLRTEGERQSVHGWARMAHGADIIAHGTQSGSSLDTGAGDPVISAALDEQAHRLRMVAEHPCGRIDDLAVKLAALVRSALCFYSDGVSQCEQLMTPIMLLSASALADAVLIGDRPIDPLSRTDGRPPAGGER